METTTKIILHADAEYQYEIETDRESAELTYRELFDNSNVSIGIAFASLDEMEAVANAMLQAVKIGREIK